MNPSTAVLLGAIEAVTGEEVVLLPNDANVIMAAEQAARHATKTTHVVPTTSVPAGLAAAVAFNPEASGADNVAAISAGLADVATGAVTIASRDVQLNGVAIEKGKWLALANGEPIAGGDTFEEAARAVVDRLLAKPHDVLTLLIGADGAVLDGLLEELARAYPAVEVEVHDGGQPHYPLLIAAE
jgi:dihydroxyacetone kinase-like predicted kinase